MCVCVYIYTYIYIFYLFIDAQESSGFHFYPHNPKVLKVVVNL